MKNLLDRNLYRQIKSIDKDTMTRTLANIYQMGKDDAMQGIDAVDIDLDKMRSEIGAVKSIGEARLKQIMEIIKDNLNIKADE